jgi:methylmalonyl-CoA mutase
MLRTHCQTSGWSLTAQDPYNNVVRTTIEAMAAVFGGTQSLHTNSLDEAHGAAHRLQLGEDRPQHPADPAGGDPHHRRWSTPGAARYMMERLTQDMADAGLEDHGGESTGSRRHDPARSQSGWAKLQIEKQQRPRSRPASTPGKRCHRRRQQVQAATTKPPIEVRDIDNSRRCARRRSTGSSPGARAGATARRCRAALGGAHRGGRQTGQGNLLDLAVVATRACAPPVGEISDALERAFGRSSRHQSRA